MSRVHGLVENHQGRYNATKRVLRYSCAVVSIVILGLAAAFIVNANAYATPPWGIIYPGYGELAACLVIGLLSILVDVIELVSSRVRGRHYGIHPGFHIASELILVGGGFVVAIFASAALKDGGYYDLPSQVSRLLRSVQFGLVVFAALFTLLRVALCITACVDTHWHIIESEKSWIARIVEQCSKPEDNPQEPQGGAHEEPQTKFIVEQREKTDNNIETPDTKFRGIPR